MKVTMTTGTYIVAVSGGVDSMVLLDVLSKLPEMRLIVAHFDHGIRSDSGLDRKLVQGTAAQLSLPFAYSAAKLGSGVSEAMAREARYIFLQSVQQAAGAAAIVTAHHQDDVIETALINLIRGTNRRGLSSLRSNEKVVRPLLGFTKQELLDYAHAHKVTWREDSTNQDDSYLRNYIRLHLAPKLEEGKRAELTKILHRIGAANQEIDTLLSAEFELLRTPGGIDRRMFAGTDHALAKELLAFWLREKGLKEYDTYMLERLVVAAKTGRPGTSVDVMKGMRLIIAKDILALDSPQR
jgi:tRNA(Ile)-lysidine synthetase-like protein